MRRLVFAAATGLLILLTGRTLLCAPAAPAIDAYPLLLPDFPTSQAAIDGWVERSDVAAMRRHVWNLWAAITRSVRPGVPLFLTWYRTDEVFGADPPPAIRKLEPKFDHAIRKSLGLGDPILGFNLYNPPSLVHIRKYGYNRAAVLRALVSNQDKIVDFPADSIVLKTVWWPVRRDGLTAFPVWDNDPTRPVHWGQGVRQRVLLGEANALPVEARRELAGHEAQGNDPLTFRRIVAIDPSCSPSTSVTVPFFDADDVTLKRDLHRPARTVPLSSFYKLELTDPKLVADLNTLPDIDDITTRFWHRRLRVGDYLVLTAVHLTTRETDEWVWGTFWWHDEPDADYGGDRPSAVPQPFRHYRMNVAYNGKTPTEADGSPHVAFNPYLEAGFSNGVHSSCVNCHQHAVLLNPKGSQNPFPVHRGHLEDNDPFFRHKLKLDMLWSLTTRPKK